jgi:hypothetical protein
MSTATVRWNCVIGGRTLSGLQSRTDESIELQEIDIPAGKAGTLTTRTDDNTGVITVASGHGITDADTVVVSWDGGIQRGVDVTATTATTISIDLGVGTNLPIATSAVVVAKTVSSILSVASNALKLLVIQNTNRVSCVVNDASNGALITLDIATGEGYQWVTSNGFAIPVSTTAIGELEIANCATSDTIVSVGILKNTV